MARQELSAVPTGASDLAGGRYRIDASLGRGGMGVVYAVTDLANGRRLALKRIHEQRAEGPSGAQATAELRREYELLSELSHPSIIRVYDYGVDERGPFYTMELLSGSSLADREVLDIRELCGLFGHVASSLSVIHARRLVHRDVSLRNIHCTEDAGCKLLDFGAVTAVGYARSVVGTPAYLAPEAFHERALDGRADLFALGACMYRLLTGRHAFAASRIDELPALWRSAPPVAHELNPSVPPVLGHLVSALLCVDPLTRPASAAEVIDRLAAVGKLAFPEPPAARRAYLATPALVGRERALQELRRFIAAAAHGRGGALLVRGASGAGRSRMLETCATQARLAGVHVAAVAARDTHDEYGVARGLLAELRASLPEAHATVNEPELRRLLETRAEMVPASAQAAVERSRALQQALTRYVHALAAQRPLLLAVDDIDRADEASAAWLIALCEASERLPLLLVFSAADDREPHARVALEWLSRTAAQIELQGLSRAQVVDLLGSVFGDVPNVRPLAERLHAVAAGQPRWVMQLCEQLVERGTVRYEAGVFIVPEPLRVDELPADLQAAFAARLAALSASACELAHAFMLEPELFFTVDELVRAGAGTPAVVLRAVLELADAGVLQRDRERFGIGVRAFASVLQRGAAAGVPERWHPRLARLFNARGDAPREAQHLWQAGERAEAVAALVGYADRLSEQVRLDPAELQRVTATQPAGFLQLLSDAIAACIEIGRPKREELVLRCMCVRIGASAGSGIEVAHMRALYGELRRDAGLLAWGELDPGLPPAERMQRALQLTAERREALPEHARGFPAVEAIRMLALLTGHVPSIAGNVRAPWVLAELPSMAPLFPLVPQLAVVEDLVVATRLINLARFREAIAILERMVVDIEGPLGAAMDPSGRHYLRLGVICTLGIIAGERGHEYALPAAALLEKELLHELNAWRVRMCYFRSRGEHEEFERCRQRFEFLCTQQRPHQYLGSSWLSNDLLHFASTDDLMGIKRIVEQLPAMAERFSDWTPLLLIGQGEYARLRGDHATALRRFERAHALVTPENGITWVSAAAGHIGGLCNTGRLDEACALGRRCVDQARAGEQHEVAFGVYAWAALSEALAGNLERAIEYADETVAHHDERMAGGVYTGLALSVRARVAMIGGDRAGFEKYAALCAPYFKRGSSPVLHAHYERLMQEARVCGVAPVEATQELGPSASVDAAAISERLRACVGPEQRAAASVELIARHAGASEAALYLTRAGSLSLRAVFGPPELRAALAPELALPGAASASVTLEWTEVASLRRVETADAAAFAPDAEFRSLLLTSQRHGEPQVVGLAMLKPSGRRPPRLTPEFVRAVMDELVAAGDADPTRLP